MKLAMTVLASVLLTVALLPAAWAQSQAQQPQPADPTAHSPATPPQGSTPPTFPSGQSSQSGDDKSATSSSSDSAKTFMGTVTLTKGDYVLRSGDKEYKLDDQTKAKQFVGKDVKVLGSLDRQNNQIHVESIDVAPNM
jgi:hypothetical protein